MSRIRLQREGGIGRIILSRPEKKNAIDREMAIDLFAACNQFEQDGQVRVVHLMADGDDFCVGADLQALTTAIGSAGEASREDSEAYGRVLLGIRALMKPVVCSVHGRAIGAGTGLATACDLVLAHEDSEFGYPEVRFGAVPALVMALLRRTVGEKHAADLVLTGRVIAAEEAERIGLVSRVLPPRRSSRTSRRCSRASRARPARHSRSRSGCCTSSTRFHSRMASPPVW
jgi:methylglutaconyl-CoA hydratase